MIQRTREISGDPEAGESLSSGTPGFLQAANAKDIEPGICAEERQIVLDRLRRNHAIEGVGMGVGETRGAHHRLWFQGEKRVSQATLDICDQITIKRDRFG